MEKHFCNYNQSLAIKELGFNEPCLGFYDKFYNNEIVYGYSEGNNGAPLKSQVFEWFREKHGLFSEIQPYLIIGTQWRYTITNRNNSSGLPHKEQFKTYEEAESACIDKLIEIIKNK